MMGHNAPHLLCEMPLLVVMVMYAASSALQFDLLLHRVRLVLFDKLGQLFESIFVARLGISPCKRPARHLTGKSGRFECL